MSIISKKLIIYLDQNFISDIAKLKSGLNLKAKGKLLDIYNLIKRGVDEDKFVVPDSWILKTETSALSKENITRAVRGHLKYLGQISLKSKWDIEDIQFKIALKKYINKYDDSAYSWDQAFHSDPDATMDNFDIDVTFKPLNFSDNSTIKLQATRDKGTSYQERYKQEIQANRDYYKAKLKNDYYYLLNQLSISIEDAEKFIDSPEFAEIPNINIFTKLWSLDLSKRERKGKKSDSNDIEFLSAYLPYCDVMAIDHYMFTNVQSLGLDKKYGCEVFSMRDDSLDKLEKFLKDELISRMPANPALFSVLCYLPKDRDFFDPEFVDFVSNAKHDFHRRVYPFAENIYLPIYFLFDGRNSFSEELRKSKIYKDGKTYLQMNAAIASAMKIFGYNLKEIRKESNCKPREALADIPQHLKGDGTALISESDRFDLSLTKDIDLFDDISESISKGINKSNKYGVDIVLH